MKTVTLYRPVGLKELILIAAADFQDLLLKQSASLETALWIAVRITEEKRNLLAKLREKAISRGFLKSAAGYQDSEHDLGQTVEVLKQLLYQLEKSASRASGSNGN